MPQVVRTVEGREYTFGVIRIGVARRMKDSYPIQSDYNVAMIAAALKAGGLKEATPEWVDENLPFFEDGWVTLLTAAYEAQGLKLELPKTGAPQGEDQPAAAPATESISDTSTAA